MFERIQENLEHQITPYFRHESIENVPQSEIRGEPVMEIREIVELRFAGDKNFAPVFPADAMHRKEGHRVITFAERFAAQYAEFQSGAAQTASGTPLEKLIQYGISPAQISLCRAVKIYSVEALHGLEGQNVRNLGMHANVLKKMAADYIADRANGANVAGEIAALKAEIEALRNAGAAAIPATNTGPEDAETALKAADEYAAMSNDELKSLIKDATGTAPRGTPSREFLVNAVRELGISA